MLQKSIRSNVYASHPSNKYYLGGSKSPSFEFLASFKWRDIQKELNGVTKSMFYDWQSMRYDPDEFFHGSNVKGWYPDARPYLADFLNKDGPSSSLWISVEHRKYWEPFLEEVENKIHGLFDLEMYKYGARRG